MFEVTKYEPPQIFVTSRRTGETYKFQVANNGAVAHEGARSDQGDARRTAIAYLAWFSEARARIAARYSTGGVF
jgi:hypothetical protein